MPKDTPGSRVVRRVRRAADAEDHRPGAAEPAYLFIVTYGRSGSTLLQGVLNSLPGYLIRGENRQAMRHLHAYHRVLVRRRRKVRRGQRRRGERPGSSTSAHPFFGVDGYPVRGSLRAIRRLALDTLLRPEPDTRVTGFKEIRWDHDDNADYVAWLRAVFPGARFVVNTRNLDDVSRSKWWADVPSAPDNLAAVESDLLALCDSLGDACFHVRYDDYASDPAGLKPLLDWLGEDYDEERLRSVLGTRHSY